MAQFITLFEFETVELRTLVRDNAPWFVLADVCRVLEIGNPSMAGSRLDEDERGVSSIDTPSGQQEMVIISEGGLYSLTLTSRKAAAKRFKKWVTSEMLPTIRRTGSYSIAGSPSALETDEVVLARAVLLARSKLFEAEHRLAVAEPKAQALDKIAETEGSFCFRDAAKMLQISEERLTTTLQKRDWVYRRPGKRTAWVAYGIKITAGFMTHKITPYELKDGTRASSTQARITAKGLAQLATWLEQARIQARIPKQTALPLH